MQSLSTFKTPSGMLTPPVVHHVSLIWSQDTHYPVFIPSRDSIPIESQQPNTTTEASSFDIWSKLIASYGRHKNLFILRAEDASIKDGQWAEIFINPRIKRGVTEKHLESILSRLVSNKLAEFEPPNQTKSVIVYWRKPEEWAEALHDWANQTGQFNTILTLYEIQNPDIPSAFTDIPLPLLRRAINILTATSRAQFIEGTAGSHMGTAVRFFAGHT